MSWEQKQETESQHKETLLDKVKAQRKKLADQFVEASYQLADGPIKNRVGFTDPTCLLFLAIIVGCFFALGGHEIAVYNSLDLDTLYLNSGTIGFVFVGIFTSLFISYLLVVGFVYYPKTMFYIMVVVSEVGLLVGAITGFSMGITPLSITMFVLVLIYAIAVFCFYNSIKTGLALVGACKAFIKTNLILLGVPLLILFFSLSLSIFHAYSLDATYSILRNEKDSGSSYSSEGFFIFLLWIFWLFFIFFLYYLCTYIIAYQYSSWYFGQQIPKSTPFGLMSMFKHIGSFVFAAMTLVLFTLSRFLSHAQPQKNTSNKPVIIWERVLIKHWIT